MTMRFAIVSMGCSQFKRGGVNMRNVASRLGAQPTVSASRGGGTLLVSLMQAGVRLIAARL
jgi:hypothetical protein